jgi:hypothetical protein
MIKAQVSPRPGPHPARAQQDAPATAGHAARHSPQATPAVKNEQTRSAGPAQTTQLCTTRNHPNTTAATRQIEPNACVRCATATARRDGQCAWRVKSASLLIEREDV